ncbi:Probable pectinesterase 55 [Linum perenne]
MEFTTSFQYWLWVTILLFGISQSQDSQPQWYNRGMSSSNYYNPISWRRPSNSTLSRYRPNYVPQRQNYYVHVEDDPLPYMTLVVDQSGHGGFTKLQSAIDSIPSNNMKWVCIQLNSGIYREKVTIPGDKPYIILKGKGKRNTRIVWDDHLSTLQSPTFTVLADNIIIRGIGFVNSYNYPQSKNRILPAVAALVVGDKISFYGCGFWGVQDTLWDCQGRHYFKKCTIEGAVDFIFGRGQSIYEECGIRVNGGGFITAQAREKEEDTSGFVFKGCSVSGKGPTYLGRPWRKYARVLFYKSNFTDVVDPKGWDSWNVDEKEVTYAEYGNYGAGADTSKRVKWEKQLPVEMWEKMTSISFVNHDGWLQQQPF